MQNLAEKLLSTSQKLADLGLNKGTSGNASVRVDGGFLITPSGMLAEEMTVANMVQMHLDGNVAPSDAHKKPSSEWRFHHDILASRPEINAVIHTHSMFAPRWRACSEKCRRFIT